MTKTQDGVLQTHNGIIKLPRFHVKQSRDTACHVLSLIMSRLVFPASFMVYNVHTTKIFMILDQSLVFMLRFDVILKNTPKIGSEQVANLATSLLLLFEVP